MAKVKGILQFFGTIDGVTLYTMEGQNLARKNKNISKKTYQTSPNYASFRDAGKEMGAAAKMSSSFRRPLRNFTLGIAENRMYCRVNALMRKLILLDGFSKRGERQVFHGIATDEGKRLVTGFSFNKHQSLAQVIRNKYELDTALGCFKISDFIPATHVKKPVGATHLGLQLLCYDFDFETEMHQLVTSEETVVAISKTVTPINLFTTELPESIGTRFFILRVQFYQNTNGDLYALKGEDCGVVEVLKLV